MKTTYKTTGVCATAINLDIEGDVIKEVSFDAGCNGNLQAISVLVEGMNAKDAVAKLKGINCKTRGTSCRDQLARAIESQIGAN